MLELGIYAEYEKRIRNLIWIINYCNCSFEDAATFYDKLQRYVSYKVKSTPDSFSSIWGRAWESAQRSMRLGQFDYRDWCKSVKWILSVEDTARKLGLDQQTHA